MILERIATELALSPPFLVKMASTASHRYKRYELDKKTGGKREIYHPARELKLVQRWLLRNVLIRLPVHPVATAYQKGASIRRNAEMHVANNYLLRVDFENFFPSLLGSDVDAVLRGNRKALGNPELTDGDIDFIREIVCRFDALTIGAPTSPQLSNAIMYDFDVAWVERADTMDVSYSRYADDLYFSSNRTNILAGIFDGIERYLSLHRAPALRINKRKTAFSSRKYRRLAAGLVLTSDRKISIGRPKKRMLRALVEKLKHDKLTPEKVAYLRGWIAYMHSVEPSFVMALQQKYELDFDADATWQG
jgi:RNA-directed DNA polymerase